MAIDNSQAQQGVDPSTEATQDQAGASDPSNVSGSNSGQGTDSNITNPASSGNLDNRDLRREDGKIKKQAEELKEISGRYERVVSYLAKEPEALKKAYMEINGFSEEQAAAAVKRYHPNYGAPAQQPGQPAQAGTTPAPQVSLEQILDPYQLAAINEGSQKQKDRVAKINAAVTEFKDRHPDLDPLTAQAIMGAAQMFEGNGLDPAAALKRAEIQILEPEKLREEGYIEGQAAGLSSVSASSLGSSGGNQRTSQPVISAQDEGVMQALGISKDDTARKTFMKHANS